MDNVLSRARAVLTTTPARWTLLTQTLPADLVGEPPAPGEWSAQACLQHLVDTERGVFPLRVQALLAGQDFAAYNPNVQGTKPTDSRAPVDLALEFARLREASLSQLSLVTPADLSRTAVHQELGRVTLGELVHEWAAHDLMHTIQAERALMQPFIRGCGPWLRYFADHVVKTGG
jgi:hypothetical protein